MQLLEPGDGRFWEMAGQLLAGTRLVIERPKGSMHPRFRDMVYPLDYGYLDGTRSNDGGGIDVWRGSPPNLHITGAVLTVDLGKNDAELKFLVGCTDDEARIACAFHNGQSAASWSSAMPPAPSTTIARAWPEAPRSGRPRATR